MSKLSPVASNAVDKPDIFLRELIKPEVTLDDLQYARRTVQQLADETNTQLKRNVYKNYALFINTAKEISSLKQEMYTLSNLLNDEQKLLSSLLETSISGDKSHLLTAIEKKEVLAKFRNQDEDMRKHGEHKLSKSHSVQVITNPLQAAPSKELQAVLDKIEGITGILDSRSRTLLMHGELTELDSNEYKPISNQGAVYAVLLNDSLVLASSFSSLSRFANKKYKFQAFYELDNIAAINVKDPNLKNAFKILMSSQTKVYVVESTDVKSQWLEAFEAAKKQRRASLSLQRRDSLMYMSSHNLDANTPLAPVNKTPISPIDRPYSSVLNAFEENELLDQTALSESEIIPDWLADLPEDLDVCIAQRNFEDAVALVHKVNDHFQLYPKCCDNTMQTDLKLRIDNKIKELVDCVSNELQITPDRSLQSGPKSARRAVSLLIHLGKSSLATRLFLAQRTALLRFCQRQQKIDGATLQYIKRMSAVFFNNVTDTCKEFQRAFDINQSNSKETGAGNLSSNSGTRVISMQPALASLISWVRQQLQAFINMFQKHVFTSQVPPAIAAECFYIVRNQCKKLRTISGLDFLFQLDRELCTGVEKIISDYRDKMLEAIKLRSIEDKWQPQNHSNKAGIAKFLEEMRECNLSSVGNFVFDECRVNLTHNSTAFAKSYLNALGDLLKLSTDFTKQRVIDAITITFRTQMKHYEQSLKSDQFVAERRFIRKNIAFIIETVLLLAEQIYAEKMNEASEELFSLRQEYLYLKNESNMTVVENGSKTKVMIEFL